MAIKWGMGQGIVNGISFDVSGIPTPKGSTTRMPNGATLPAGTTESRKRMAQWREDVRHEAKQAMGDHPPLMGPIRLYCDFRLVPPKTGIRKSDIGWKCHTKKPDVDKLFRALADAMTGIVWVDDSQICVSLINKSYAWDNRAGASVEVETITDDYAKQLALASNAIRSAMALRDA